MKWTRFPGLRSLSLSSSLLKCKTHQSMLFNVQLLLTVFSWQNVIPNPSNTRSWANLNTEANFSILSLVSVTKKKDQYSLPETNCILLADNHYHLCWTALSTLSSAQGISFENLLFTILPIILHLVTFYTRKTRWSRSLATFLALDNQGTELGEETK